MSTPKSITNTKVVFPGPRQVVVEEEQLRPPSATEIRVETQASMISTGTECAILVGRGWKLPGGREMPQYPASPGYSNAGMVVEIGKDVESFRVGDRVASSAGHARYPTVPEGGTVWKIPDGVDFEEAAFCTLACTVLNGVRLGRPQLGDAVVVVGLGILGQMACQFLKLFGARPLIGIDVDDFRVSLASRTGTVSHAFNPNATDLVSAVEDLTEGRGADIVYEVTGLTETYDLAFELARDKGCVVGLGSPRWPGTVNMMQVHMKALRVLGAIVSSHPEEGNQDNRWTRRANGRLFLDLLSERALDVGELITHRFPYRDAPEVYRMLLERSESFLAAIFEWPEGK